jgi:hypothetical protein
MKKIVLAVILSITASSAIAQTYASWDPDPNVRLQLIRESQAGGS